MAANSDSMMLPVIGTSVIYKPLAGGAILFSTKDEVYFGLNAVGARVWQLLPPTCTRLDELLEELAASYPDIAPAQLRADVTDLLEQLAANSLVEPRPSNVFRGWSRVSLDTLAI